VSPLPAKVLLDTTVYVDILQRKFPANANRLLRAANAWHSTVTQAELSVGCSLLNPTHPGTMTVIASISDVIENVPAQRTLVPDREIWISAGLITGLLARLQQYSKADRYRLMNDALLLETARKTGLTLLTRNVADFDLMQQIEPTAKVLFYRT
jgi:predicted nucleic acid-binding protein